MERLIKLRKSRKLTQSELAIIMNVAKNTVSQWESSKREPNLDTIKKLANVFNVSVDYLIGNDTEEKHAQQRNAKVLTQIQQEVTKKIAELPDSDVMRVFDFIQGITAKENEYFKLK